MANGWGLTPCKILNQRLGDLSGCEQLPMAGREVNALFGRCTKMPEHAKVTWFLEVLNGCAGIYPRLFVMKISFNVSG